MAKTNYKTWTTGETVTAAMLNEQIRDNGNEIWKGTTQGDLDYYNSSTTKNRIAIGASGQVLKVVGGVPAWSNGTGCNVHNFTGTYSIPNDTQTYPTFAVEMYDSNGFFSPTSDTITIPVGLDGFYMLGASGYFSGNADTELREVGVKINTFTPSQSVGSVSGRAMFISMVSSYPLVAGDTLKFSAFQKSGGALNLNFYSLWIAKVG